MAKVALVSLKVGDRFRKEYTDIEKLSASMHKYGLIEPIVIDQDFTLIAGGRRLKAAIALQWNEIDCVFRDGLGELERKELELEENLQRKEMGWQEEVNAKNEIHKLKREIHGAAIKGMDIKDSWKLQDTANALGESSGTVSMDLQLAQGIRAFPELLKEKSKTAAYKKLKRLEENIIMETYAKRMSGKIEAPEIVHGNCIEEMGKLPAGSIDLIITDPPWGIDVDESHAFDRMSPTNTRFDDSEFATIDLLDKAIEQMWRVLKFDTHLYLFFAIDLYSPVRKLLEKHGFQVHPMPLIWDKGSGSYPSQQTSFVHSYETFFFCKKGARKLNGSPRDIFLVKRVPPERKLHPTEKPTELLRDLIKLSSMPGEIVLDPFAGSGATLTAARESNRQTLGIELDGVYVLKIKERLQKETPNANLS